MRRLMTTQLILILAMFTLALTNEPAAAMEGHVVVSRTGNVAVHTYVSPDKSFRVTTHIIEGPNKLVLVDAQFLRPYAKEVRAYADGLNKPIDRIIVTHGHPDHWFGLESFQDENRATLPEIAASLAKTGQAMIDKYKPKMGDIILDKPVLPDGTITEGRETIDGVVYVFECVKNAESELHLLVTLPEQGVLVAQDLVYNKVHAFVGNGAIENWTKVVDALKKRAGIKVVLAGHGEPGGPELLNSMTAYLATAQEALARARMENRDISPLLTEKYPDYSGRFLLDVSNGRLFPK